MRARARSRRTREKAYISRCTDLLYLFLSLYKSKSRSIAIVVLCCILVFVSLQSKSRSIIYLVALLCCTFFVNFRKASQGAYLSLHRSAILFFVYFATQVKEHSYRCTALLYFFFVSLHFTLALRWIREHETTIRGQMRREEEPAWSVFLPASSQRRRQCRLGLLRLSGASERDVDLFAKVHRYILRPAYRKKATNRQERTQSMPKEPRIPSSQKRDVKSRKHKIGWLAAAAKVYT